MVQFEVNFRHFIFLNEITMSVFSASAASMIFCEISFQLQGCPRSK